jgi:hypothetical protein
MIVNGQLHEDFETCILRLVTQYDKVEISEDYRAQVLSMAARRLICIEADTKKLSVCRLPPPATVRDANKKLSTTLKGYIGGDQLRFVRSLMRGEEGQFFIDKMLELAQVIETMPKSYETDGMGDEAIVHLHYFSGSADWYVTERDMSDQEEEGPIQAFGLKCDRYGARLGYINCVELTEGNAELDFHFRPRTLAELKRERSSD